MHIKSSDQERLRLGIGEYTCNWGTHIAGLYESEAERDEIIFGFLGQGDIDHDRQLYCPSERSREDFVEKFSLSHPDCAGHLEDENRFNIYSAREMYYPDGIFSPWDMDEGLNKFYRESQKNGPRNIRATAEMIWALKAIPGTEHLMAYESRLNYFIPGKPWISICMYNVTKFPGATIMNVLRTHPFVINGGIISQNPYYIDPDIWLAEHAPEFLTAE
ncbi:MAG: MEDS domain-containing protein [Candidatus Zixiibacteriota bacterium]